ncbi:MAG: hypothetical protein ACK5C0_14020 [Candidatus Kapaibacterium sp.]|jgi:hypothetical protein
MKRILRSDVLAYIEGPLLSEEELTLDKVISGDDETKVKELLHTIVKPYIKSLESDIYEQVKDIVSYIVQKKLKVSLYLEYSPVDFFISIPTDMHLFYCWVWDVVFSEDGEQHIDINEIIFDKKLFPELFNPLGIKGL